MKSSQAALLLLFLLSLGTLSNAITFGWGRNDMGQLGLGHRSMVYRPTQIAFFNSIELLDALPATNYIIFISKDGPAYGSGYQYYGQLANGYTNTSAFTTPILCPNLNSSLDISLPGTACNANFNTNLLGWGNLAGYVLNRNVGSFSRIQTALSGYKFDGKVLSVHSAMEATIVRLANNSVWSSGNNGDGRLGIGHTTTIYNFSPMTFWTNVPLKQIFSSQSAHICALAVNGSLFCWGRNAYGQLGVGDTATHYTPTLVPFFDVNGYEIYKVVYGDSSTFVLTCGGTVFSFGANGYGQLGHGNPTSYGQLTPRKIEYSWDGSVVDIVAGIYQIFARTDNDVWYVWGAGTSGALGIGFATDLYIPNRLDSYIDTTLYRMNKIKGSSQSQNFFGWWDDGVTNDRLGCPVLENECLTGTHLCDINAQCSDFERGYNCSCRNGYSGDGRLTGTGCINQNTCSLHPTLCDVNALCEDTPNGPACTCNEGFTGSGLAGQCTDINECEQVACGDNTICTNTAPGYYCTCMEGYYGDQPDVTGCKIICQPGQYAFNTTYCAMCEPGRYSDVEKATNCMPCPAGTYAPDSGTNNVTGCLACPVGGYSDLGAMYCSLCAHGYTNDPNVPNRDNSTCFPCPLGTYGYYGQCLSCNGGQYSDEAVAKLCKSCPPGYSSSPVNTYSCVICPAGTSSRGGTTGCNACPAGYFSAAGSKDCSKCPPGTSTNGLSSRSACTNCSAGYFASKAAAQSCQACPAGTYADKAGSTDCTRCDRGTFATGTARSNCSACAFGTYSPGTAATKCIKCESGSQSSPDRKSCIPCSAGEYFDSPTDTCKPCSIGTSNPFVSALSCTNCAPGSYASESGSTYCKRCPVNTYSNAETGFGACTPCPPGQKSSGGASSCS